MATPAHTRRRRRRGGLATAAGLVAGLVVAGIVATPAAAAPTLSVSASPDTVDLKVGGDQRTISINIQTSEPAEKVAAIISVPMADDGVTIKSWKGSDCTTTGDNALNCTIGHLEPNKARAIYVTVAPPQQSEISPGDSHSGTGQVQVAAEGAQPVTASYNMNLSNDAPQSVGQISGAVQSDKDGSPIPNASVTLTDGGGTSRQVTTNGNGEFRWTPSDTETLAAGQITATVDVDGYKQAKQTQQGTTGQPLTFTTFKLAAVAKAKPTKTHAKAPSPTPTAVAEDDGGLGTIVWVLIILGALLVIGGIVAIILLVKKKDEDDDGHGGSGEGILPFDDGPRPTGYPQRGAGETAVLNAVPNDDAPTMVHNGPLVRDDGYPPYPNAGETQIYGAGGPTQAYGAGAGQTQAYGAEAPGGPTQVHGGGPTQVHGGETQVYGAQPPSGPPAGDATGGYPGGQQQGQAQPWQQSDRGVGGAYEGTMYGRGAGSAPTSGAAPASGAPTSGYPGAQPSGGYPGSGPAPTSGYPGAQPTSGYPGSQPTSGYPGSGAAPTSGYPGGQPTSGAGPASGGGYPQSGGAPAGGYGQGSGYGQPGGGQYGAPGGQQYGQGQQQYGQPAGQSQQYGGPRPDLNEPTGVWQPNQQQPGQQQQQQPRRPAPPSGDETRLDRNDGVDWLD